jgi:hypothetical protein
MWASLRQMTGRALGEDALEAFIRTNDAFFVKANEVKPKNLTPYQGREDCSMFGRYRCSDRWSGSSHTPEWTSAYSYKNEWQKCQFCS